MFRHYKGHFVTETQRKPKSYFDADKTKQSAPRIKCLLLKIDKCTCFK